MARLPAGLIRPGPAAEPAEIARVESTLGAALPTSFVSFLRSFDGADLFHEAVVIAGVGGSAPLGLMDINTDLPGTGEIIFAEVLGGDRYAFDVAGRVLRLRAGSDERWIAGGDYAHWLDGIVAYQRVLYGPDGEFMPEAFEPDGGEVSPPVALKQADRALRRCDDSAEWHHERGVALRRLGRILDAKEAFAHAAAADPENPWPLFDLGRAALTLGPGGAREAGAGFEAAAKLDRDESAARMWIWAARAALLEAAPERLALCRREAIARDPVIGVALRRARDAALLDDDPDEVEEAQALLDALEIIPPPGRTRLPVVTENEISATPAAPTHRTRRPDQQHPARSTPRRSAGPRTGRRH